MRKDNALFKLSVLILFIFSVASCRPEDRALLEKSYNMAKPAAENQKSDPKEKESPQDVYTEYMDTFEEVFKTMQENYYAEASRAEFDRFVEQFNTKIYANLKSEGKSDNYVRWRSAALLVDFLKTKEDIFSAFYPPEPAQEYKQEVLGVKQDLGIEGKLTDKGFETSQVEPRSDAYTQGLRIGDVLTAIDGRKVFGLKEDEVIELLTPLIDSKVKIAYVSPPEEQEKIIEVLSKGYFKQAVFDIPTAYPRIYCIQIQRFSRTTAEDMFRFLQYYKQQGPVMGLIIDLRGNPGGPPLAAREISSFFLKAGEDFAYFNKKGQEPAMLDVPQIPDELKYEGPMVILIDKESGSASELFSGVMQRKGRTILMGKNSAGQVMLKSMFSLKDTSMLLLITSRGYYPDGSVFSFDGLVPDRYMDDSESIDILDYAAKYLVYVNLHPEILKNLQAGEK